jgi:hypothetical protein
MKYDAQYSSKKGRTMKLDKELNYKNKAAKPKSKNMNSFFFYKFEPAGV